MQKTLSEKLGIWANWNRNLKEPEREAGWSLFTCQTSVVQKQLLLLGLVQRLRFVYGCFHVLPNGFQFITLGSLEKHTHTHTQKDGENMNV